ncbi:MAG: sugar phosphate isomerase/epimerase family protein [bacterium]
MKLSLSTYFFIQESLNAVHAIMLRKMGFDEIELWAMPPHLNPTDTEKVKELAALFNGEGITVGTVHGPFYETMGDASRGRWLSISDLNEKRRSNALGLIGRTADAMVILQSRVMVLHFGATGDLNRQDVLEAMLSSLISLQDNLSGYNIKLAFENLNTPFSSSGYMKNLLDRYDFSEMGLCFDTGHANVSEEVSSSIAGCGSRLCNLHISDNNGFDDQHLIPGKGNIDWARVWGALKEIGYDGNFTVEVRSGGNYEEELKEIREFWDNINKQ